VPLEVLIFTFDKEKEFRNKGHDNYIVK